MADAKATGSTPQPNGSTNNRTHNDGSSSRAFTAEQKAAVLRVRKCNTTAFYDILGLESVRSSIDDAGIKKAYRKLSLLTHPDKNGYDGADEAFKMVSRAFQILSDPGKKRQFDQFGGDPDNRFASQQAAGGSPFSGFGRSAGAARGGGMFEEEISPEELFRQFFGGGLGGGGFGGPFGTQSSSSSSAPSTHARATATSTTSTTSSSQAAAPARRDATFSLNFNWSWGGGGGWSFGTNSSSRNNS